MRSMLTTLIVPALLGLALTSGCAGSDRSGSGKASSGSPTASTGPAASNSPKAAPAPCARWSCQPGDPISLGNGYTVRLWLSATPSGGTVPNGTPVVELLRDSAVVQWWTASMGLPWMANLTCVATAVPNCVVTSIAGAHAGSAELVLLRSGALTAPARARVVFDNGAPRAIDLDHDGYLDVVGSDNDYQPNYATGHNFWATYRFHADALTETGCAPAPTRPAQPPNMLLHGRCPVRPGAVD